LSNAAPTIAEAVDNVFTRFDADANAAITAVEMLKVLDPNGTHTGLDTLINNIVAKLDTNADGSLSKAEVTVALTAMDTDGNGLLDRSDHAMVQADEGVPGLLDLIMGHGGPDRGQGHGPGLHGTPPAAPTIAQVVDGVFTHFDKDASTTISLAELLAVLDPKGTHTERDADLSALFKQIDTNTDSSLSVAEVTAAVTALDTDHSGTLTPADLVPGQMPDATVDLIGILLHGGDGPGHGF
jgi:Ca2+-binding EF-hand superfamily protein